MTQEADDRLARRALDFYSFVRVKASFKEAPYSQAKSIQPRSFYNSFTSHSEAQIFLQAYADMENKYMELTVAKGAPRQELLSASLTLIHIASAYSYIANYAQALKCCQKALDIREEILGKGHPDTADAYHKIAMIYEDLGDRRKALEWIGKSFRIRGELPKGSECRIG